MADNADLQELCSDFADDLAQAESLDVWSAWIVYTLQELERQSIEIDAQHPIGFERMLERLHDAIGDRLTERRWKA